MTEISNQTHDLREEDEIILPVQRSFPNCRKYKKCCDVNWNPKLENVKDTPKPVIIATFGKENSLKKPDDFEKIEVSRFD